MSPEQDEHEEEAEARAPCSVGHALEAAGRFCDAVADFDDDDQLVQELVDLARRLEAPPESIAVAARVLARAAARLVTKT